MATKTRKSRKSTKTRQDSYEQLRDQILDLLKQGIIPWERDWNRLGVKPYNVQSKKAYRGVNIMLLGCQIHESPVWGTYRQWQGKGGYVRKGEKATTIYFWKILNQKDENGAPVLDSRGREKKLFFLNTYKVFNACQVEGIELSDYIPTPEDALREFTPVEAAQAIVENYKDCPPITHGGDRAYYSQNMFSLEDKIVMPKHEQFKSDEAYYRVLFHELSHSTGSEKRLNRDMGQMEQEYSFEELVAELGSCFLSHDAGIEVRISNSASYIGGWLKKLKDSDPKFIMQATTKAVASTEYILGNAKNETETETD